MNDTDLQRRLGNAQPSIVRVTTATNEVKDLRPATGTRKRWLPIMSMLARMDWRRLELLDARGAILDLVENDGPTAPPPEVASKDGPGDAQLKLMIAAQREALTWQDKSVRNALDTVVGVMQQLADAVAAITELHRAERAALHRMIADVEDAAAASKSDMPQSKIVEQLAPVFLAKMMAPDPPKEQ